jgi:hypothetical protein
MAFFLKKKLRPVVGVLHLKWLKFQREPFILVMTLIVYSEPLIFTSAANATLGLSKISHPV